jgi:DUF4097 and DUF4098 domain-containing protein YvlB
MTQGAMKMKTNWIFGVMLGAACLLTPLQAQDDAVRVPFRDASGKRMLKVQSMNGSITVKGYDGKEAIIEGTGSSRRGRSSPPAPGMHQLNPNPGLEVTEENNTIRVNTGINGGSVTIQVPVETSLDLQTINGGHIIVENISGEIVANNLNGAVTLTNVSGSVVANSNNGRITANLTRVTPNKSMSFCTMNGNVEVTLPADIKANVKLRTDNGEIWTDFDVKISPTTKTTVEDNRKTGGRYRVRVDHTIEGTINGGGPEMQFRTFNGRITIAKK